MGGRRSNYITRLGRKSVCGVSCAEVAFSTVSAGAGSGRVKKKPRGKKGDSKAGPGEGVF